MRLPRSLLVAAVAGLVAVAPIGSVLAFSEGRWDRAQEGCGVTGCHGPPSDQVTAVLELPDNWTRGERYPINLSIEGALPSSPTAENRGGFNLEVDAGTLHVPDGSEAVQVGPPNGSDRQATHTAQGNDRIAWTVEWEAPANGTGNVTVWLAVNAVNGNGLADPTDAWTTTEATIPHVGTDDGQSPADDEPIPDRPEEIPGMAVGAAVAALLGAAALVAAARDPPQ